METAKPLTPSEVREVLDGARRRFGFTIGKLTCTPLQKEHWDLLRAINESDILRATLERYAELAEEAEEDRDLADRLGGDGE